MARRLGLLLLTLSGCLYPWDHAESTTTGEPSSTTSPASTGDTSTDSSSTTTAVSGTDAHSGSDSDTTGTTTSASATATSATTGTTTDTTSGPVPVCGDGILHAPDEECDDGNLDPEDGCDADCARDRLVFATSIQFSPDMIGGLKPADSLCKQLAHQADLPNWASFSAWLSDSAADAVDRVHHGRGRYRRPDGVTVATSFDALLAGPLLAPIAADEFGAPTLGGAWTGTRPDGTAVPAAPHCADWTSNDLFDQGHYGAVEEADANWTLVADPDINPTSCVTAFHLYCFEGK